MRFLLIALLLNLSVFADVEEDQDTKPGTTSSSSPVKKDYPPVRRFSVGGYVSYSGLQLISNGSATQTVLNSKGVSGTATYTTAPKGGRSIGVGAVFQYALVGRYAVAGDILFRKEKYHASSSTTIAGKTSSTDGYTSADLIDIPILFRWYSKTRTEPGQRFFIEAGPSFRWTHNVRTSVQNTDTAAVVTCCTEIPDPLAHSWSTGFSVGGGYQLVDQLGVHLIPGVRYTRWLQPNFNNLATHSNSNQVEAGISITF